VLLHVHRSAHIGSPRVVGSTSRSRAARIPGLVSVIGLRPAPGRRTRRTAPSSGGSRSSFWPDTIVLWAIPVCYRNCLEPSVAERVRFGSGPESPGSFVQVATEGFVLLPDRLYVSFEIIRRR